MRERRWEILASQKRRVRSEEAEMTGNEVRNCDKDVCIPSVFTCFWVFWDNNFEF